MKKKAFTLIEVIVSMALMAILIIPASQLVIAVSKNNRAAQIKKETNDIGQNILENIRNIESCKETDDHNIVIKNSDNSEEKLQIKNDQINEKEYITNILKKNGNPYELNITRKNIDGKIHYMYSVPISDYKKNYKVDIECTKQSQYENTVKNREYEKTQSYIPKVGTESDPDEMDEECKNSYDLILKFTNDYYIENKNESDFWKYDKTDNLVLVLDKDDSNDIVAELHKNNGSQDNVKVDPKIIYSQKIFNMSEIENKYKDKVNILLYLCNNDSKKQKNPYKLNQTLAIQSNIDKDDSKPLGSFSDNVSIDVLSSKDSTGNLDVLFDGDKGYVYNVNNFYNYSSKRKGNLYLFNVNISLDDENRFSGSTTAIIDD